MKFVRIINKLYHDYQHQLELFYHLQSENQYRCDKKYLSKLNIIRIIYREVYASEVKDDLDLFLTTLMSFHIEAINPDVFV